ncbi:MAG: TlpA family protein disulfide reductase [Cyclobacteriaceae bacterium]|nr:TlpA family protein disulfide reductase [Cyclobacteriaceae bacterium]MCX7636210.1 TlpA family protein disulfide reductase [Cyclobacteriaceae bacterium]MDW8331388.1 TlpA disulfide reductase family protein [Cyclobacteriaceae bacterium]
MPNNALQPHATLSVNEEKSFDYAFTIKDLNNRKIPVEKFRGKVLFINLWATWCGPCRAEMPTIEALYQKVNREEIQFIILSIDDDLDNQKVRRFIEKNRYTFPVFMPSGNLPQQLQVPSIPVTLIIDKQGNVVRKKTGMTNYNTGQYVRLLEELATKN